MYRDGFASDNAHWWTHRQAYGRLNSRWSIKVHVLTDPGAEPWRCKYTSAVIGFGISAGYLSPLFPLHKLMCCLFGISFRTVMSAQPDTVDSLLPLMVCRQCAHPPCAYHLLAASRRISSCFICSWTLSLSGMTCSRAAVISHPGSDSAPRALKVACSTRL